ncbi:MlaE family ABC transporter permease [Ramlibacter tataouinensis]|uniref:Candidate ABC transporter, permease component n=1 Tax=Ramlibacter tataouinensis (strain ATCC BAA-407 / DSM 14655 / LMG 21543 / TTB310) TaxID=365046 RepID=F5Y4Q2_RAMTT|nr:ABC transporter permease [Ramlibacter tataouinensis]AEG91370.1 candidate ABC transporter, permease component [Ramlibacter tataouinensis TTB310]
MPRLEPPSAHGGGPARVLGQWTAAQFARPRLLRGLLARLGGAGPGQAWDLSQAEQLDHVGAQLLWDHWGRRWPEQLQALPAQRAILERVAEYTTGTPARRRAGWRRAWLGLGSRVLHAGHELQLFVRLIGQLALNLGQLLRAPHLGPWRDFSGHLYRIGATALPITALVGFLIGVVLAYLTSQQLRAFGADAFIVNILGIALIRELGPMLAAILIAGRSGSAITAQIGVMRVTDELDAMSVMGISHSFRLVLPRALALAIAMPLISTWTTLCSLAGGLLAAYVALGITPTFFLNALPEAVSLGNLVLAVGKSVVFGLLIALVGCHFGLRVEPNTQSLGQGTTASVVTAITVVILVDALFAIVFQEVGL